MQLSSGIRNFLMSDGSLKAALDGSVIRLYSGTAPTSANDAVPAGATELCVVSVDASGTGVTFEASSQPGLVLKTASEVWEGTVAANGTATWFRVTTAADDGSASTTMTRLQGSVAQAGGDMQITNPDLVSGEPQRVDYLSIVMPAA